MKKIFGCTVIAIASMFAFASPKVKSDNARLQQIWTSVENRLSEQTDIWFTAGNYLSCINLLRFMNAEDPKDYEYATNLGWMLENVYKYDEALSVYVRYRKLNPNLPDAPFPEAFFYFQQRAYSKVPPLLASSLAKHPHPNSYRLLAHAYEHLGLYLDAEKVWKKLLALNPNDGAAKMNLSEVEKHIAAVQPAG